MKKRSRIFLPLLVLAFGIVLLAFFFVSRNLDSFVAAAIEAYSSDAAGVPVKVKNLDLQLRDGEGAIDRIFVSNPNGFSNDPIFSLEKIRLAMVPGPLTSEGSIIKEIHVQTPTFLYEVNESGEINLDALRENLRQFTQRKEEQDPSEKSALNLRIESLIIEQGKTIFDFTAVGGKRIEAERPRMVLTDIGGEEGITPEGLSGAVFSALIRELEESAAEQGLEQATGGG